MKNEVASDVPVSMPVIQTEKELVRMNGFAWTQQNGIVVGMQTEGDEWLREMLN